MTKYILSILSLILFSSYCYAEIIPKKMHDKVIERAMNNYWSKVRLKDGSYVQPSSEKERKTVPIAKENAAQVIYIGEISSLADWCGLDWQQNFFRVTKAARNNGLSGKQVAFIGLLHGVAMGVVDSAVKGKECTPEIKDNITDELNIISNKLINFAPTEPPDHIHGNKGANYWEQGKLDLAEQETRKAIELNPKSSLWYQNLGFILESAGQYEESIHAHKKSLAIDKDWGAAYKTGSLMLVGYDFFSKRNYKKSIAILNEALATAVKESVSPIAMKDLYLYLSYNYTDANPDVNPYYDLNKAHELKAKAYEIVPHDLFVKASITKLLILQDNISLAKNNINEIENALAQLNVPNSSAVYSYLGHIYSMLNDAQACSDAMTKSLDIHPTEASRYLLSELNNDFKNVSDSKVMEDVIKRAKTIATK